MKTWTSSSFKSVWGQDAVLTWFKKLYVEIRFQSNIKPAFYNQQTIDAKLVNKELDKIDKLDKSEVHKALCGSSNSVYIRQTGRKFYICFSEHINVSVDGKPNTSNLAKHIITIHRLI